MKFEVRYEDNFEVNDFTHFFDTEEENVMEFNLNTSDIQKMVIALIMSPDDTVVTKDDKQRLLDKLTAMNNFCRKENDYTLTITVRDFV